MCVINRWNHFSDTSSVAVETRSELQLSRGNPGVEGMSIAARLAQIEHFLYNLACGVWTALLACKAEHFDSSPLIQFHAFGGKERFFHSEDATNQTEWLTDLLQALPSTAFGLFLSDAGKSELPAETRQS